MSKELDELLNDLLKEIPPSAEKKPTEPPEPPKPTEKAFRQAERIAQDVEEDKSWQIPPETPKPQAPPPQHEPVVVPPPISHFTDVPSANPAIRMRDRLDETALPKPDVERKPTQIMDVRPRPKRKKRRKVSIKRPETQQKLAERPVKKTAPAASTAPTTPPKRKIPHIEIPDELPPDIPREQPVTVPVPDVQRQDEIRSRAELIREQLRRRSEEGDEETAKAEQPAGSENAGTDAVTVSIRKQEAPEEEKIRTEKLSSDAAEQNASGLHHLRTPEEPKRMAKPSFFSRFRQRKEKKTEEESNPEDAPTDWRTLAEKPEDAPIREIVNGSDTTAPSDMEDEPEEERYPEELPETLPMPEMNPEEQPEAPSMPEQIPPMPAPEPMPKPPHSFAEALREAFDETAEELAEMKAEPLPEQSETVRIHFLKRHSYFLAGIICFLLALVGLVTCIRWGWGVTQRFAGSASLRQTLERVLYPVAVVDLPAFESPGELDAGSLLSAAMMDILMYDDLSVYPENFDVISIPAGDVLARAQTMFGTDFRTEFDTLHAAGETFFYDNENGCYNVPSAPVIFSYSPEVTNIRRDGDICTVTVLYHSDLARWQERSENFDSSNEKTMQVTLLKTGDAYQIMKIANVQTGNGE